jgi:hypothetical protein
MRKVKRRSTAYPTHRYQIASIIIFLAGIDKILSLTLQLLYITGHIQWDWIKTPNPRVGYIGCGPGLTKKINKLKELGLDLDYLRGLIGLRNLYIHDTSISVLYKLSHSKSPQRNTRVCAIGPEISFTYMGLTANDPRNLRIIAKQVTNATAKLLNKKKWYEGWKRVANQVAKLPCNPNGIEEQIYNSINTNVDPLEKLNRGYIGEGLSRLL